MGHGGGALRPGAREGSASSSEAGFAPVHPALATVHAALHGDAPPRPATAATKLHWTGDTPPKWRFVLERSLLSYQRKTDFMNFLAIVVSFIGIVISIFLVQQHDAAEVRLLEYIHRLASCGGPSACKGAADARRAALGTR